MVVAEAYRNLIAVGATPLAMTDCLNYGSPEKKEIYQQLIDSTKGMAEACEVLKTPVVSGNVSLYNETRGTSIFPTPVVGMVGLIEDIQYLNDFHQKQGIHYILQEKQEMILVEVKLKNFYIVKSIMSMKKLIQVMKWQKAKQ